MKRNLQRAHTEETNNSQKHQRTASFVGPSMKKINSQLKIGISVFKSATNVNVIPKNGTWGGFAKRLTKPRYFDVSARQFHEASNEDQNKLKNGPCYILGEVNGTRSKKNLISRNALTFDLDDTTLSGENIKSTLNGIPHIAHTTTRSTKETPRWRVIVPLSRVVTPSEYNILVDQLAPIWFGEVDKCSSTPSQLMYFPSIPKGGDFEAWNTLDDGDLFNPDAHSEDQIISATEVIVQTDKSPPLNDDINIDEINEALSFIPADDYDTWVKAGMALENTGHPKALEIFRNWSSKSDNYSPKEIDKKWFSFGPTSDPVTVKTIYHLAQKNGWKDSQEGDHAEIIRLAQLPIIDYERERDPAAKKLGLSRVSILDNIVKDKRGELSNTDKTDDADDELYNGITPWETCVDGDCIATSILNTFNRYTILPQGGDIAMTLWVLLTYCFNAFRICPKLLISSPEKRCGKTTTIETLSAMVHRSLVASNISPAVIYRAIEKWKPTMLIDEGDTFIGGSEELRGIINSGHTRSTASVMRIAGDSANLEPRRFSTWAPTAIAMIKIPPDTILDRSVTIKLRRKLPEENIERLPQDIVDNLQDLRRQCQRWGVDNMDALSLIKPVMPKLGNDRAEDNWRPLLIIAEQLGGNWPTLARDALLTIEASKSDEQSITVELLADIRQVFQELNFTRIHTRQLVDELVEMEERPWCEWRHGNPMTRNSLARLLKPFGIKSKQLKIESINKNGYELSQFEDAFSRYIPVGTA